MWRFPTTFLRMRSSSSSLRYMNRRLGQLRSPTLTAISYHCGCQPMSALVSKWWSKQEFASPLQKNAPVANLCDLIQAAQELRDPLCDVPFVVYDFGSPV